RIHDYVPSERNPLPACGGASLGGLVLARSQGLGNPTPTSGSPQGSTSGASGLALAAQAFDEVRHIRHLRTPLGGKVSLLAVAPARTPSPEVGTGSSIVP